MSEEAKSVIEEIVLTELVEDEKIFESHGVSVVKVTKGGTAKRIRLGIKSTGVADLIDTYSRKAPTPPAHKELIEPESEMGKQMGISKKRWVRMPDFSDDGYMEKKEAYERDLGLAVMIQGLDVNFKDKDGNIVDNSEHKIRILKSMGMTGDQFVQIVNDIQDLTRWDEEKKTDFFEES